MLVHKILTWNVSDTTMARSLDMAPASPTDPSTTVLIESVPSDLNVPNVPNGLIALNNAALAHLPELGEARRLGSEREHHQL